MTKHLNGYLNLCEETDREFRKDMMRVMSELTNNPANVAPEKQEELAMFMVNELRSVTNSNILCTEDRIAEPLPKLP